MKKRKYFFIFLGIVVLASYIMVIYIGKKLNPSIMKYAVVEARRITTSVINTSINEIIEKGYIGNDIFTLTKNSNDEIEMIDFNPKNVNELLKLVSQNIQKKLLDMEKGNVKEFEISDGLKGKNFSKIKYGIVCETTSGSIFGNSLFANTGPIIPVKMTFIGDVSVSLNTQVKSYGINNAYLEMNIEVVVTERLVVPMMTEDVVIKRQVPIAMKVIEGKIPVYYNGNIEKNSQNYSLPIQ